MAKRTLLIVEPDATTMFGHYVQLIDRLSDVSRAEGMRPIAFGAREVLPSVLEGRPDFHGVFSGRSWDLGLKSQFHDDRALLQFSRELRDATSEHVSEATEAHLFMYLGSPQAAAAVLKLVDEFPNLSATLNLFWLSFPQWRDTDRLYAWKHTVRAAHRHPRIQLLCSTAELAALVQKDFEVGVGVLPHPSTTFSDAEVGAMLAEPTATRSGGLRVLFPGTAQGEKGFLVTVGCVSEAARRGLGYSFSVRAHVSDATPNDLANGLASISPLATVYSGELTVTEYKRMFTDSDVVIIPYSPKSFAARTSGAFIDAVYCGKPTICQAGTWMARIISENGIGETTKGSDPAEYLDKLARIERNYPWYAENVKRFARGYFAENSWQVLLHATTRNTAASALSAVGDSNLGRHAPSFASIQFSPDEKAHLDECQLVFEIAASSAPNGIMIDVGAHHGGSLARFARAGWTVHAFEPDPQNREKLAQTFGSLPNVRISPDAVAGVTGQEVPFFASDESSGISSLTAFHASHREVARVRTVTLDDVVTGRELSRIDFLKIDIEGWELPALRAFDFNKVLPGAIVAEFEDSKTAPQGYDVHDMAQLLVDNGYVVFVSEWYPIERYGVRHSFRRIRKYPCAVPAESWGNLVAFKEEPASAVLKRAIRASVDRRVVFEGEAEWEEPVEAIASPEVRPAPAVPPSVGIASGPTWRPAPVSTERAPEAERPRESAAQSAVAHYEQSGSNTPATSTAFTSPKAPPVSAKVHDMLANLTRAMRRSPFASAFVVILGATLLTLPFAWPLLSAASAPELILALLIANLVLTANVARIVRKSLASRLSEAARKTEDLLRQFESRNQRAIRNELSQLEDRIASELRRRADWDRDDMTALRREIAQSVVEALWTAPTPAAPAADSAAALAGAAEPDIRREKVAGQKRRRRGERNP